MMFHVAWKTIKKTGWNLEILDSIIYFIYVTSKKILHGEIYA